MYFQTDYIILRKVPFQESSLIVSGLSPEYGRLDFLLKGVRGSGAKKFPYAGLFRELSVEFRENHTGTGLLYMRSQEPKCSFDSISEHPENYLRMCSWAQFLLKHTRPMLAVNRMYAALHLALVRLCGGGGEFQLAAAELVFLHESGFVPDMTGEDPEKERLLHRILDYALDPGSPEPGLAPGFQDKLIQWIRALSRYAESC